MPKHTLDCDEGCENLSCPVCVGGLAFCTTCKGAEGSLPTDCPGEPMSQEHQYHVYAENVDFTDQHGWHNPKELETTP